MNDNLGQKNTVRYVACNVLNRVRCKSNDPAPGSTGSTCIAGPKDKQQCMDNCIAGAIGGDRPNYSAINVGGSSCQKWANDTVNQCASLCGAN